MTQPARFYPSLWPVTFRRPPPPALPTMMALANQTCAAHGISMRELRGPRRQKRVAHIRQEFMALAYATGRFSLPQIGRFLGRDHTTVLHGVRVHAQRISLGGA